MTPRLIQAYLPDGTLEFTKNVELSENFRNDKYLRNYERYKKANNHE